MVKGMCPWKNFDELEDSLILDELLLLNEQLARSEKLHYRILGSFQGINLEDEDDHDDIDEELPEEVIAADRAWKERKAQALAEGKGRDTGLGAFGIGHSQS